jgi:hypothetical protein
MLPIVFGYPMPETFAAAERGEIVLGGCVVWGEDPTHRCGSCGIDVILDLDPPLACTTCGRPLLDDPEDDPIGAAGSPLCGDCNRARNFDAIEELEWLAGEGDNA